MKATVIGCGRWGSFIAWYLDLIGHEVTLYGRKGSARMRALEQTRTNGLITLGEGVALMEDLGRALEGELIAISVGAQVFSALMEEIAALAPRSKTFVLCMKGIEVGTDRRLSQIAEEAVGQHNGVAVWLGPGHVQEFTKGVPNCMVIDSASEEIKARLVEQLSGDLIRFYYGTDLIGNEIGAAAKNVIGIAAGMLDGMGLSSLKGALMSRGTREIARLIAAMGGSEISAYGLCHLGDYEATVFSPHSHNRRFGEVFVRGEAYNELAEGYATVKALCELADKRGVELPICRAVYAVLYEGAPPEEALSRLFTRSLKREF
ncbi:MAG: NAD(P)H-dependent glycerol-3-phosphate dehydrogenase [Clostridia bacterium]|nr:NAD(P)H-dependent glycerol-3-phosphate dehydrogenase [Clostridia bacterium]